MLFVDSAGANTVRNNRDLMVKRNRYTSLPLPLAAMSLYTLQAFAPGGGAGKPHVDARRRPHGGVGQTT